MDASITQTYSTSPSAVAQALLSSKLAVKWVKLVRVDDYTHAADGSKATIVANIPAERFPPKARTFAGSGAKMTIITVASGNSTTYTADPHDLPAEAPVAFKLSGDTITTADPPATLKVKIFLSGRKVGKGTAGMVDRLFVKDAKLAEEIIEKQGS